MILVDISRDPTADRETDSSIILVADIESIITKLDAECKESPCTFTEAIKTTATESLDTEWTTLHEDKTAEAVQNSLTTAFSDFGQYHFYWLLPYS